MSNPLPGSSVSTPDIPASKAKLSLQASTFANAKASVCFSKIVDSAVWRDWNDLCPEVLVRTQPAGADYQTTRGSRNLSVSISGRGRVTSVHNGSISHIEKINEESREDDESGRTSEEGAQDSGTDGRDSNENVNGSREARKDSEHVDPMDQSSAPRFPPKKTSFDVQDRKGSVASEQSDRGNDPNAPYTGRFPTNNSSRQHSVSHNQPRLLSVSSIYNEPSVHLHKGTAMTLHHLCDPSRPRKIKKIEMIVTELHRPDQVSSTSQAKTPGGSQAREVFRIVWSSDTSLTFPSSLPKWLRYTQRVVEVRPVVRGDGSEECEISMWECQRGLLSKFMGRERRELLQRSIEQNVRGLKANCEAMGGAVDRRDFSISL